MNSSITDPGEVTNVPSNPKVSYGGNDYGTLKVVDTTAPTCTLKISTASTSTTIVECRDIFRKK